jgi:hypothetical protein
MVRNKGSLRTRRERQFQANGEPVRASAGGRRWRMGSYYR